MSSLRKSLSPTLAHKAWPYLVRWCDLNNDRMRCITQHVAAFFSAHQAHAECDNLGSSLRALALSRGSENAIDVHERYLKRILAARDSESLCTRLEFVMRMLKSHGIPVNYETLYKDIVYWNERTQIQWANSYYIGKEDQNVSDENNG
jgi:CRISPR type I-E-associated protein CasB/Cse2